MHRHQLILIVLVKAKCVNTARKVLAVLFQPTDPVTINHGLRLNNTTALVVRDGRWSVQLSGEKASYGG